MKKSLYSYNFETLETIIVESGEKRFRAKQIWDYLYNHYVGDIQQFKNLPQSLRLKLSQTHTIFDMSIAYVQQSSHTQTKKYLITLKDGHQIECVLMHYAHGYSLCVSTQVGCAMGCNFCASTIDGLARNLEAYEIWQQILLINYTENIKISNIVLMGSGEPLHNYDHVLNFIKTICNQNHLGIGQRHITLSTCGLVDKIRALAKEKLQITLAVSLHSPFDSERSEIVPANKKYGVNTLVKAMDEYIRQTNRRVSIEYALIEGKNDGLEHADAIIKLFKGKTIHINLIPVNTIDEKAFKPTKQKMVERFKVHLQKNGLNVTVRRELGDDIDAACGQLRRNFIKIK